MNIEIISSIARSHRDELLREAATLRSVRGTRRGRTAAPRRLAIRLARAAGSALTSLGDALAKGPGEPAT